MTLQQTKQELGLVHVVTDIEKIKEYHLKRLYELSLKSLGEIPLLDELSFEQEEWFKKKMKGSAKSWETWDL
jgi:hypothetical protein